MRSNHTLVSLYALCLVGLGHPARAQLKLDSLPPSTGSSRFFEDRFAITHPSLSLNGFDCTTSTRAAGCSDGFGLRQVLERVYSGTPDPAVLSSYEHLLQRAGEPLDLTPTSRGQVYANTNRMQARAFVGLVTYILEQNGNDLSALNALTTPDLPRSHQTALAGFKEVVQQPALYQVDPELNPDAVKWPSAVANVARALDLYLALENAYAHYGEADWEAREGTRLLSCAEKLGFVGAFAESMGTLEAMGGTPLPEIGGLTLYAVQSGNWPLRVQVALGYGALTQQHTPEGNACGVVEDPLPYEAWLRRAFESAAAPTDEDRSKHWSYQTANGSRFWAEGPYYFHLVHEEVVSFWHAVRINALLDAHPDFDVSDPFRSTWFTQPLHWLADLSTPDGKLPPLDDGNKQRMYNASLLRWSPAYGDAALGRKFAWINGQLPPEGDRNTHVELVALAIPRIGTEEGRPPVERLGPAMAEAGGEQQVILRRRAGDHTHYVLLNGETGAAVHRGEGHEQGDQLQLLYYVDGVSYLLDSGYDTAAGLGNSTWNRYDDHNVMAGYIGELGSSDGGVIAPQVDPLCPCITSIVQQGVEALFQRTEGRIDVLKARMRLVHPGDVPGSPFPFAGYERTVLFIGDPKRPYLIDINAAWGDEAAHPSGSAGYVFRMRYHGNAPTVQEVRHAGAYAVLWEDLYGSTRREGGTLPRTNSHLLVQPFTVEYPLKMALDPDGVREVYAGGDQVDAVQRLSVLSGPAPEDHRASNHTTVAFIRAISGSPAPSPGAGPLAQAAIAHPGPAEMQAWQYYTWQQAPDTLDVLAVRSAAAYRPPERGAETSFMVSQAGDLELVLPQQAHYGFARLVQQGEAWTLAPGYGLNLRAQAPTAVARDGVPAAYRLAQNYPNPFNPSTEIGFELPQPSHVQLVVFDVLGREVARLVDEVLPPGLHRVTFAPENLPSGPYLYRLTAGSFTRTRRMILLK